MCAPQIDCDRDAPNRDGVCFPLPTRFTRVTPLVGSLHFPAPRLVAALVIGVTHAACAAGTPSRVERREAAGPIVTRQTVSRDGDESVLDFYEVLGGWGYWVDDAYGSVWVPRAAIVGDHFVPYASGGTWVRTDAGWVFQTKWDKTWGWAVFHYGRWYESKQHGWVWAPEVVWSASWVQWRYGVGYVGWAPAAPEDTVVAPGAYTFVETKSLLESRDGPAQGNNGQGDAIYAKTQPAPRAGVPEDYLAAGGVASAQTHIDVPPPGSIREQAQLAGTQLLPGSNQKKPSGSTPAHSHGSKHRSQSND